MENTFNRFHFSFKKRKKIKDNCLKLLCLPARKLHPSEVTNMCACRESLVTTHRDLNCHGTGDSLAPHDRLQGGQRITSCERAASGCQHSEALL